MVVEDNVNKGRGRVVSVTIDGIVSVFSTSELCFFFLVSWLIVF